MSRLEGGKRDSKSQVSLGDGKFWQIESMMGGRYLYERGVGALSAFTLRR